MITITEDTYIPYDKIPKSINPSAKPDIVIYPQIFGSQIGKSVGTKLKDTHTVCRHYKKIPKGKLQCLLIGIVKLTGITFDSYVINGKPTFHKGPYAVVLFLDHTITIKHKNTNKTIKIPYSHGTMLMFKNFDKYWSYSCPKHMTITFFNSDLLSLRDIYLSEALRTQFMNVVRDKLNDVRKQPIGKQCVKKYLKMGKMLGKGDYGNVYQVDSCDVDFAIKMSKLKPDSVACPYSRFYSSWFEVLIMRDIFNPLVQNGTCINLPLLLDSFVCNNCKLTIRGTTAHQPCVILITELANGSFRDFLKLRGITAEEIYSALFQIMVSLHAIQLHGQIMNFDVKADNILFYDITPGGYWEYVIHGKTFYVPNKGRLFVLNDFGISRPMSPNFQLYREPDEKTFRLGSRFAIVKKGKFSPLKALKEANYSGKMNTSPTIQWSNGKITHGAQFRLWKKKQTVLDSSVTLSTSQKRYLEKLGIPPDPMNKNFFLHPEIIPPFEFYNDTQDAIRIFVGGKRTTQRGNHRRYPVVTDRIYNKIKKYNAIPESMNDRKFSTDPSQVLAGYFIEKFFTLEHNYTVPIKGKLLGTYIMST